MLLSFTFLITSSPFGTLCQGVVSAPSVTALFKNRKRKAIAQAVDEFAKQLKIVQKSGEIKRTFTVNAKCDALLILYHTHVISGDFRFSVQTFLIT